MEAGAEQKPPPKKRLTVFGKAARRKRIFARLKQGWAYDEIAREERLTATRVRQIVKEVQRREMVESDYALLRLSRLGPALRAAGEAVAQGDVRAIAPLMKVLDRLDRYQKVSQRIEGEEIATSKPAHASGVAHGLRAEAAIAGNRPRARSPADTPGVEFGLIVSP